MSEQTVTEHEDPTDEEYEDAYPIPPEVQSGVGVKTLAAAVLGLTEAGWVHHSDRWVMGREHGMALHWDTETLSAQEAVERAWGYLGYGQNLSIWLEHDELDYDLSLEVEHGGDNTPWQVVLC